MQIDPRTVKWDDAPTDTGPKIDPRMVKWQDAEPSGGVAQEIDNLLAGLVRGAGSIGASLLYPWDSAQDALNGDRGPTLSSLITGNKPMNRNQQRRADMDSALRTLGAETDSLGYGMGKLAAEIGGTAGLGGALGQPSGFVKGLRDPIDGGAQLLTNMLPSGVVNAGNRLNNWLADTTGIVGRLPEGGVDQQVRESEQAYQAQRGPDAGIDWARIGGNVLNPANLALASKLPAAATTLGRIGVGALGGASSAVLNPVTQEGGFAGNKMQQIGTGAAGGALVPALTAGLGRIISPAASRNPELQLLQREGVRPTVGQALGGRWNAAEEKLQSLPLIGDMISKARNNARDDFNRAALNRVTAPIGKKATETGQAGVQQAGDLVGDAYAQAKNQLGNFRLDRQGVGELQKIRQMADMLPDATARGQFQKLWGTIANDISPNGTIKAEAFKRIDSKLAKEAARFSGAPDAYQQQLGDALAEVRATLSQNALRANPQAAQMMKAADTAYANLVRVEGASKNAMQTGGLFTPGQLGSAVRQADQSVRDRATARGTALMQDLAGAGQSVLGNKVPNSATADRLMLGAGGLGLGALNPAIPAGLLAGAGLYTSPMQGLLRGAVTARPQAAQAVRQSLLKASPGFVPAGAQIGLGLLDY